MDARGSRHFVLKGAVGLGILFLWFPLGLIILYAFTTDEVVPTFPPPGLIQRVGRGVSGDPQRVTPSGAGR